MLAHHRIELQHFHLVRMQAAVLGGGVVVAGVGAGDQFDFLAHGYLPQTFSPRARMSWTTASSPNLSMMRMPLEDTRRRTKRFSLSSQNRWVCRFGRKRRRVLLLACETLFPVAGAFPVTWQTLDMAGSS